MTWPFDPHPPLSYDVILADPPWHFENYSAKGERKGARRHYATLGFDEIAAMPVSKLGRGDCILFMWCCWPTLPQAVDVLERWGFRYVTGGAWHKRTSTGKSAFGTGYVMRSATEPYLIGTLGNPKTVRDVRNVIETSDASVIDAERREHSRKPEVQYETLERMFPAALRRIELFARNQRPKWDAWGNETKKFGAAPNEVPATKQRKDAA
jgi:N6-adenosine-specific RNA methylase IME4